MRFQWDYGLVFSFMVYSLTERETPKKEWSYSLSSVVWVLGSVVSSSLSSLSFCDLFLRGERRGQTLIHSSIFLSHSFLKVENYQWKIECFLEDLLLGGQSSIILGYRRFVWLTLWSLSTAVFLFPGAVSVLLKSLKKWKRQFVFPLY
jgi:hypothetical protein